MDDAAALARTTRFDPAPHVERMRRHGWTVIENFLDEQDLADFRAGVAPLLGRWRGRNAFEGRTTERVYTLVGRGRVFESIACDPRLMAVIGAFLRPNFLLSASHAISIFPGEVAQALHTDDAFYLVPRPRPALAVSVIGAIDAFTVENGATVAVPGSHLWSAADLEAFRLRRAGASGPPPEAVALEMPAGAIAVFPGTLVHGAGSNRSAAPRLAFTSQYCEPWLRTQENFHLAVPRERVRAMAPQLQSLLGYSIAPPFLGMVTASHPLKTLDPDWTAPITRGAAQ
ncbi:MAG TPA: phytanoyl-CoA dioxygenase family protein [Caulobacteraceae bacterium]|nr:phytanoyl-CoA dioxygenase family protein [Caulobacteraceae bacterium]